MRKIIHAFAFLPWVQFLSQGGSSLVDHSKLEVALGTNHCKEIQKKYTVDLARSDESRARGLGGRATPLKPNEGMLFLFEKPQRVSFWMKDTLIPLEILYFDASGKLTDVYEMPVEKDPANPARQYMSRGPTIAALEVEPSSAVHYRTQHPELCAQTLPR